MTLSNRSTITSTSPKHHNWATRSLIPADIHALVRRIVHTDHSDEEYPGEEGFLMPIHNVYLMDEARAELRIADAELNRINAEITLAERDAVFLQAEIAYLKANEGQNEKEKDLADSTLLQATAWLDQAALKQEYAVAELLQAVTAWERLQQRMVDYYRRNPHLKPVQRKTPKPVRRNTAKTAQKNR